jgi:excisionase family DNA binding protein
MTDVLPRFLNLSEASDALGVHRDTVREWFDKGKLTGYRTPGGHRRILLTSVQTLMEGAA